MTSLAWPPASLPCLLLLLLIILQVDSLSRNHKELEFSIEDVTRVRMTVPCHVSRVTRQGRLDKVLDANNFTAVFWYARNCKRSENVLIGGSF